MHRGRRTLSQSDFVHNSQHMASQPPHIESRLETDLALGQGLACAPEVLATEHAIKMGEVTGVMAFPCFPEDYQPGVSRHGLPLLAPRNADTPLDSTPVDWGNTPWASNEHGAWVKTVRLWFPFHAEEGYLKDEADRLGADIYRSSAGWVERFVDALEVLTYQDLGHPSWTSIETPPLHLRVRIEDGRPRHAGAKLITLDVGEGQWGTPATLDTVRQAVNYAERNYRPTIEHLMLREAMRAVKRRDQRASVIAAGTAAELALTSAARRSLQSVLLPAAVDVILDKSSTLGGRLRLCNDLGIDLPHNQGTVQRELIHPRNDAAHEGLSPSHSEVVRAVKIASDIVLQLSSARFETGGDSS